MKILQINKYSHLKGGSERHFLSLVNLLKEKGHEVFVFSMTEPKKLQRHLYWSFSANRTLEEIIKKFQPDIAHLHNIYHDFSPSILYTLKKHHIPVIMTLHDYKIICPNYKLFTQGRLCERCQGGKYYNCALHRCINNSIAQSFLVMKEAYLHQRLLYSYERIVDQFISPSEFLKNKCQQWGIRNKIAYLPNYIDWPTQEHQKKNYFLYVGRLTEEKGVKLLPEIIQQTKIPWKIVGTGPLADYLKQHLPAGILLGQKNGKELKDLIGQAKAIIVPSVWYENNPLIIMEAHSQGTWVIASKLGGIPELIKDGINGTLVSHPRAENFIQAINKLSMKKFQPFLSTNKEEYYQEIIKIYEKNQIAD